MMKAKPSEDIPAGKNRCRDCGGWGTVLKVDPKTGKVTGEKKCKRCGGKGYTG